MEASIFDVLTGTFATDRSVTSVSEDQRLLLSVASNLNRLFNTRRGTIGHLPDYGLPDMLTVYRDSPQSAGELPRDRRARDAVGFHRGGEAENRGGGAL